MLLLQTSTGEHENKKLTKFSQRERFIPARPLPPASTRVENVATFWRTGHEKRIIPGCSLASTSLRSLPEESVAGRGMDFVFGDLPGSVSGESSKCVQLSPHSA